MERTFRICFMMELKHMTSLLKTFASSLLSTEIKNKPHRMTCKTLHESTSTYLSLPYLKTLYCNRLFIIAWHSGFFAASCPFVHCSIRADVFLQPPLCETCCHLSPGKSLIFHEINGFHANLCKWGWPCLLPHCESSLFKLQNVNQFSLPQVYI